MNFKELKYIAEYPRYAATPDGKIYSFKSDQFLKPIMTPNGYYKVSLCKHGSTKQISIHRIVASLFCKREDGATQVNHINGIKSDNRYQNLEWCTASHNMKHAYSMGLAKGISKWGESNSCSKLTEVEVEQIITAFMQGKSQKQVAKLVGVNLNTVRQITSGRTWRSVSKRLGYTPKFGFKDK